MAPSRPTARRLAGTALAAALLTGTLAAPAAVAGTTAGTATAVTATTTAATTVFSDDFESGTVANWTRQRIDGNGSITVTGGPAGGSGLAGRFSVPNDGQSYRSEVAVNALGWGGYRFAFADYLPADWVRTSTETIVAQWHGYPLADGSDTKPPIALTVKDGNWRLKVHWLTDPSTVQEAVIPLGAVQFGHWNQWAFDVTWSTATTPGSITVLRDGVQVGTHSGLNNYHQNQAPYFKTGIYRANWNPAKGISYPTGGPDVVLYSDSVVVTKY
ncbi:polysaccharide lyase [Kitasatospora sp. NPDC058201]|uniref:polysaccharide lyase n=1 Tax=Streptomycetaceae TaxID=2062 RepID=UPI002E788FD6|nr:polysaccharide lyase [Streptomyces sp. BE303]MED7951354.1 polysaccharide lyase [Streptomyces sp. BE303]